VFAARCMFAHHVLQFTVFRQGVCHRDIKPENILFTGGEGGSAAGGSGLGTWGFHEPVITDFGLAVRLWQ
jgi:serine/threonine protein kinase